MVRRCLLAEKLWKQLSNSNYQQQVNAVAADNIPN